MTVAAGTAACAGGVALALLLAGVKRGARAADLAWELGLWAALAGLSCWLYAPYLRGVLVGAGDAYHYALQAADLATQLRAGHFPVFVGASAYAFSGNIHTLRTAPYLLHFIALLDFLTRHRLAVASLLDLTIMVHALGLALTSWRMARSLIGPAHPAWSFGVAALYILSPAIAGTVQAHDLVATFLTLPWLPVLAWAIVRLLGDREAGRGAVAGTGALAALWWAHPPVAAWSTALWAGAWGVALFRRRGDPGAWLGALVCAAGLIAMTAYCFVSVLTLDLGASFGPSADIRAAILRSVQPLWPGFLIPSFNDPAPALRPGYALWLAGLAALLRWRGRSVALNWLLGAVVVLLLFLGAIPLATPGLWNLVPDAVVRATHAEPVQRLAPILAALLLAGAALGARRLAAWPRFARGIAAGALALLVAWSVQAIAPMRRAASASARTPAETAEALDARNVYLMWASYGMFTHLPDSFTHGRTSAPWEMRLLQEGRGAVIGSNAAAVVAAAQARGALPVLRPVAPLAVIPTQPGRGYVLEFVFARPSAPGDIELSGQGLYRSYALPSSGEAAAFGSAPGNGYLLGFGPEEHDGHAIRVRTGVAGVSVRSYPFDPDSLPLRVESLLPLRIRTATDEPAWLETPRSWIPGYRATVDGAEVPVVRSPEGLVMLPLPAGRHRAEVRYAAPPPLGTAYGLSLLALAGWAALFLPAARRRRPPAAEPGRPAAVLSVAAALILAGAGAGWLFRRPLGLAGGPPPSAAFARPDPGGGLFSPGNGAVRLGVVFPAAAMQAAEPLLLTGKAGAADLVFVRYLPGRRLQLGFDHWGVGGPLSEPLDYTPGTREEITVEHAALFDGQRGPVPPEFRDPARSRVVVRWNGRVVLDFPAAVHPGQAGACVAGANPVGASSCGPNFTGSILEIHRFLPGGPGPSPGN